MKYLCALSESFLEGRSAYGHYHEFLNVNGICCMSAAVKNVHHRNGKSVAAYAAEESVKRHTHSNGSCSCSRNGNSKDSICAEL